MDPILLDAAGSHQMKNGKRSGITWVPGKLVLGTEELWSNAIQKNFDKKRDSIISFNPITDKNSGFESVFQNVKYLESVDDFMTIAHSTSCVVSERYHACIYALATGMPAIGVCLRSRAVTSKIEELFRRLGIEQAIIRSPFEQDRDMIKSLASAIDIASVKSKLMIERQSLVQYIAKCLETI
jgi:polysaccharide pyruvyl transferase WcaK-like protein